MQASLIGPGGQRTELPSDALTIGRAPDNLLVLPDQQASSHHAEIRPNAQGYLLVDLNSRNGTFVNEQSLQAQMPRLLVSGDVIRIGDTRLTYAAGSEDDATVRASGAGYASSAYSPTVAVPPPQQPDFASYQQPAPPAYSNYPQQSAPSAPNYPQAGQPYPQPPQAYPAPAYPQQPQAYPQQAPWAGTPGQFGVPGAPAATQPRKSRTGLIIGLIVLLVLIVGGGIGAFLYISNRSTPEKTLQAYCTALVNNNAQDIFNLESKNAQQTTGLNAIKVGLTATSLVGGIKNCVPGQVTNNNGTTANGVVTLTFGNGQTRQDSGILVNENGTWKLGNSQQAP